MQDAKEEVRERLNIEDVISEYVPLKRAGRNFRGFSPFNQENTPSFYVSPDKHIWHDFSSNKGGDIFSFIMEVEGLDFRSSLELLARKAGVDLSLFSSSKDQAITKLKRRLHQSNDLAASYYQQTLLKNSHALEYVIKSRQLNKQVIADFRLGYAPSSGKALVNFLSKRGFNKTELNKAGLLNRFNGDIFKGRITIPLMDASGQIIGFTGRIIIDDDKSPKYLNTPQTLIYDKSRHVFGLSQAKEAIRKNNYVVIVEGNMDVISSHQVGVKQVVATAGTAMTEYHLKALSRLSSDIRLAFDGDKAGLAATERAIGLAQSVGVELSVVSMPDDYKDPDELIRANSKGWLETISKAKPAVDWVIDSYASQNDLKTAQGKRHFTDLAIDVINRLEDSVEQEHYIKIIASLSDSSIESIKQKLNKLDSDRDKKILRQIKVDTSTAKVDHITQYIDSLLALTMIDRPSRDLMKDMSQEYFSDEPSKAVYEYVKASTDTITDTPKELQKFDTYVRILLLKADARYASWNERDRYHEASKLVRRICDNYKKQQKLILDKKLKDAESIDDEAEANKIRIQISKLIKEIKDGKS